MIGRVLHQLGRFSQETALEGRYHFLCLIHSTGVIPKILADIKNEMENQLIQVK